MHVTVWGDMFWQFANQICEIKNRAKTYQENVGDLGEFKSVFQVKFFYYEFLLLDFLFGLRNCS